MRRTLRPLTDNSVRGATLRLLLANHDFLPPRDCLLRLALRLERLPLRLLLALRFLDTTLYILLPRRVLHAPLQLLLLLAHRILRLPLRLLLALGVLGAPL